MKKSLLITGGVLRPNGFELGEGKYYQEARLLLLDLQDGSFSQLLSITKGNENYPDETPNLQFTAGAVDGNNLWLPTDTEIHLYNYPDLNLIKVFSHPCFHNVHSVSLYEDKLFVTSTGLDMVVVLDKETGSVVEYINADGKDPWYRFSIDNDYRKVHSTRPHDSHPNYVFWLDGEAWVTRCTQENAVCLSDVRKCMDISGDNVGISVHDGHVHKEHVYFTTVDGCLVNIDQKTRRIVETIKLYEYEGFGGVRGWCRGLLIDDDIMYVAFSRMRKTKAKGKLSWVKRFVGKKSLAEYGSILAFDIRERKIVNDYRIPEGIIDAIYSLLPEPSSN